MYRRKKWKREPQAEKWTLKVFARNCEDTEQLRTDYEFRDQPQGWSLFYANNEPKSALARDLGDCRDNKGKLAKRVFTC